MNRQIDVDMKPIHDDLGSSNASDKAEFDLGILLELGSIGAGHAATALSEVLQQKIEIEVPKIHNIAPHLIPKFFDLQDMPTESVYMQLREKYGCDILLSFELTEAKKIAAMMSCAASIEELTSDMEISAILELSNILIGAFLTAISDFIQIGLLPTTPQSVVDSFDAVLDYFLIKQSMVSETALIFETRFKREGETAKCILIIFPSEEMKDLLAKKSMNLM
jgi:chemotaxis protein CheC